MEDMEFDFDLEIGNYNEESIRKNDEAFAECLKEELNDGKKHISIINPIRVKEVRYVSKLIKKAVENNGAKVVCDIDIKAPLSIGYVSITGRNIRFSKPQYFEAAAKIASNVEIYPKTDGTIQVNFTFHNVTVEIGEEDDDE